MPSHLEIPSSNVTVKVSIINSTAHIYGFPMKLMVSPEMAGMEQLDCPSYCFLIEHTTESESKSVGQKVLFDLGVRKDWQEALPPHIVNWLINVGCKCDVKHEVPDILGTECEDINYIVLSHEHWDHTGDASRFPTSTELLVGPGFKAKHYPGYPTNPSSSLLDSTYQGREVRELDFSSEEILNIGGFQALDFFRDGSFYILNMPGHAVGHLGALARTSVLPKDSFILMGGDACHHAGEIRPTALSPLPDFIEPDPRRLKQNNPHSRFPRHSPCPAAVYTQIHRIKSNQEPFYITPSPDELDGIAGPYSWDDSEATLHQLMTFDARDDILVLTAHDTSLLALEGPKGVTFYPSFANEWMEKGWKELIHWYFLGDFELS